MSGDEPKHLKEPPSSLAAVAAALADFLDEDLLEAGGDEDDDVFFFRVGTRYMASTEGWDAQPYEAVVVTDTLGGMLVSWPPMWGVPEVVDGAWRWQCGDTSVTFRVTRSVYRVPDFEEWMDERRNLVAGTSTMVVGGRRLDHHLGAAVELAEVRCAAPRALRISRWIWDTPALLEITLETPESVSDEDATALTSIFGLLDRP